VRAHLSWVNRSMFPVQIFDVIKKSSITQNSLLEKRARLLFRALDSFEVYVTTLWQNEQARM